MERPERKAAGKPRRVRFTLILTICLVVFAGLFYFVLLPYIQSLYPSRALPIIQANKTVKTLGTTDYSTIDTIEVRHSWDGESYTLVNKGGTLYLREGEELIAINEAYSDEIFSEASEFIVQDTVSSRLDEVKEGLTDMELDPARITVDVTLSGGDSYSLLYGGVVPETPHRYFRWTGSDGVYMIDVGSYECFEVTAKMLLPGEQIALSKNLIDLVRIERPDIGVMEIGFLTDIDGRVSARLLSPISYPISQATCESILTALGNLRLGTFQGALTDENRAIYGLDAPAMTIEASWREGLYTDIDETGELVVKTIEKSALRLSIGREEGDYFRYAEYRDGCYYVNSFLMTTLLNATPESLITRAPADMGEADIKSVTIQKGDRLTELRISRTERVLENNALETDDSGNILYDVTATVNGTDTPIETAEALIARLKGMTVSGELPKDYQKGADAPRWQIVITTEDGESRTITAYPLDALFDAVYVDGTAAHYIHSEAIDIILGQ